MGGDKGLAGIAAELGEGVGTVVRGMLPTEVQIDLNKRLCDGLHAEYGEYHFILMMIPKRGGPITLSTPINRTGTAGILRKVWKKLR